MQTRTYGDLFSLIQSLAGVGNFTSDEQSSISRFINRRYEQAFETTPIWTRFIRTSEERQVIPLDLTISNTARADGNTSSFNQDYEYVGVDTDRSMPVYIGKTYPNVAIYRNSSYRWVIGEASGDIAIVGAKPFGTVNLAPIGETYLGQSAGSNFAPTYIYNPMLDTYTIPNVNYTGLPSFTVNKQYIPYSETNVTDGAEIERKENIGIFQRIHRKVAFQRNSALEYDHYVDRLGAHIINPVETNATSAFVTYKQEFSPFAVSSDYTTSTVEVPSEFFHYIAHASYADFLRMDGQTDKALIEEQNAQIYLDLELDKIDLLSNQNTLNKRISTYVNRRK